MTKNDKNIHSDHTPRKGTKAWAVIQWKMQNPGMNLKEIAAMVGCSHSWARTSWSRFIYRQITLRGSPKPLPFHVQNLFYWNQVPPRWLADLPLRKSLNRNQQRIFMGKRVTAVFHKNGDTFVYPYYLGWEGELRSFLADTWGEDQTDLFMTTIKRSGKQQHIAFHTPGIPSGYKVRIKGIGRFVTDKTPYPDGSTEFEFDPAINKRMDRIEKAMGQMGGAMKLFAQGMSEHMRLIKSLQKVADAMQNAIQELRNLK